MLVLSALLFAGASAVAASVHAPDGATASRTIEEAAVLATVEATLAAVSARDEAATLEHLRSTGTATAVFRREDGSVTIRGAGLGAYADATPGPERYAERIHDPLVRVHGPMAMVWARYSFAIDGQVKHCGYEHFDLVREAGQWKIQNVTWTVETVGCDD